MTLTTVQDPRRLGIPLARTLCLLAILALINYIDRGNLSIAAPLLKGELHFSASQLGILIAAFFWTYTVLMPVGGWRIVASFKGAAVALLRFVPVMGSRCTPPRKSFHSQPLISHLTNSNGCGNL